MEAISFMIELPSIDLCSRAPLDHMWHQCLLGEYSQAGHAFLEPLQFLEGDDRC